MSLPIIVVLIAINVALAIGSIYRALHPDPSLPPERQYSGAIFGLLIALAAILLLVYLAQGGS